MSAGVLNSQDSAINIDLRGLLKHTNTSSSTWTRKNKFVYRLVTELHHKNVVVWMGQEAKGQIQGMMFDRSFPLNILSVI